ncbi:MAG TPA: hypothetical protein VFH37_00030, partial [Candidatus Saccharimonadales bacterium]|nr:hypothetical protein [Candidatus Saccharimonadales bacterium]
MKIRSYLNVRLLPLLGVLLILLLLVSGLRAPSTSAAPITARSLTLEAGTDPGSKPSGVVKHLFTFTIGSTTNLGSIQFLYCTTPDPALSCTLPAGLVTTSATLSSQTGANTGFTLNNTTNGAPYLTRTAASGVAATSSYELSTVTNPNNTTCFGGVTPQSNNCTFYVRISTFATTNATGAPTDIGSVAASTATPIVLQGYMPESLVFCTGATVSTTAGVPDCSTATTGNISFNQDFSPTDTATATSQMAASTNAGTGYQITVNGGTLTSGANSITGIGSTAAASVKGTGQFGLNLKLNTAAAAASFPGTSAEVSPLPNGTNLRGQAVAPYNTADNFAFHSTDSVSDSGNGGLGGTDAQIFTVSYIV